MKIENQVCSLELAQQLKSLGVKHESLFYWTIENKPPYLTFGKRFFSQPDWGGRDGEQLNQISAFTVAELGEMLPEKVCWRGYTNYGGKWSFDFGNFTASSETEADARAKMLIYLLEQGLIKL